TDVGDLASQMKMKQLEAIEHVAALQLVDRVQNLADRQAELASPAARRLPPPATACGKLDPHADLRPDADLLGIFKNQRQLGVFLDNRNYLAAHLLGQHRHLDKLGVFEAVADDRRLGVGHGNNGQHLGLAAGFEAEPIYLAVVNDLLDDVPLLVDLDRVDADVAAFV